MRIKIIDLPDYETDPNIIAEHLQKVLKEIRKKKLARDLIGEDERSAEFEVDDFDEFAETLSSGIDLTMFDKRRIAERASKLANLTSVSTGSHLDRDGMDDVQFADYLVFAGAGMFVLGYLIINQVILRLMLLVGTLLYIWYYGVVEDTPLWPAIWASTATGGANVLGLINLLYSRSALAIPRDYKDIYQRFSNLPPGDFAKLMRATDHMRRPEGHRLATEGAPVDKLYYILEGTVRITKGASSFEIAEDTFIGEIGYECRMT